MTKIIFIKILLFTTFINSQSLIGKKYVAYLGNKCGDNFTSFFYTELNFETDKVIVLNFLTRDFRDFNNKQFIESKKYNYKIENNNLTIIGSKYSEIAITENQLQSNQITFNVLQENKIFKIIYNGKSGGKDGFYVNLEITKDSIKCKNGGRFPSFSRGYFEKINLSIWEDLNENFDLTEFKKLKGQQSIMDRDDYDEEIIVEVDNKKYSILNAVTYGEINKNILEFINLLRNQIRKFEVERVKK